MQTKYNKWEKKYMKIDGRKVIVTSSKNLPEEEFKEIWWQIISDFSTVNKYTFFCIFYFVHMIFS